jgi:hypothetical protein
VLYPTELRALKPKYLSINAAPVGNALNEAAETCSAALLQPLEHNPVACDPGQEVARKGIGLGAIGGMD